MLPAEISPALPPVITLLSGSVRFAWRDWPCLIPSPHPRVIALLFDYTCPQCRAFHPTLLEASQRLDFPFSLLGMPVPMDVSCSPPLQATPVENANASLYARYALTVWRAAPTRFLEFHQWMMAGQHLPRLPEVFERAEAVIGVDAFTRAWADPIPPAVIDASIQIYQTIEHGNLPLPILLLPHSFLFGELPDSDELIDVLRAQLGIDPPAQGVSPFGNTPITP